MQNTSQPPLEPESVPRHPTPFLPVVLGPKAVPKGVSSSPVVSPRSVHLWGQHLHCLAAASFLSWGQVRHQITAASRVRGSICRGGGGGAGVQDCSWLWRGWIFLACTSVCCSQSKRRSTVWDISAAWRCSIWAAAGAQVNTPCKPAPTQASKGKARTPSRSRHLLGPLNASLPTPKTVCEGNAKEGRDSHPPFKSLASKSCALWELGTSSLPASLG